MDCLRRIRSDWRVGAASCAIRDASLLMLHIAPNKALMRHNRISMRSTHHLIQIQRTKDFTRFLISFDDSAKEHVVRL